MYPSTADEPGVWSRVYRRNELPLPGSVDIVAYASWLAANCVFHQAVAVVLRSLAHWFDTTFTLRSGAPRIPSPHLPPNESGSSLARSNVPRNARGSIGGTGPFGVADTSVEGVDSPTALEAVTL